MSLYYLEGKTTVTTYKLKTHVCLNMWTVVLLRLHYLKIGLIYLAAFFFSLCCFIPRIYIKSQTMLTL
jgi:hypothetical protein